MIGLTTTLSSTLAQSFTGTTTTGTTLTANSLTSGSALAAASSGTGVTGSLGSFTLSGSNAGVTGNALKATVSGTLATGTALMVTNAGAGNAFRVNDDGTDTDTTPFIIDASGRVLVGTDTYINLWGTTQKLVVAGTGNSGIALLAASDSTGPAVLTVTKTRGAAITDVTAVQAADNLFSIAVAGADGTTNSVNSSRINFTAEGTIATNIVPGRMTFHTADSAGTLQERMRIDSTGKVGIGVAPAHYFDVRQTNTDTSGTEILNYGVLTISPASSSAADYFGMYALSDVTGTANVTGVVESVRGIARHSGSGTLTDMRGLYGYALNNSTGIITAGYGAVNLAENSAANGTITSAYGAVNRAANSGTTGVGIVTAYGAMNHIRNDAAGTITTAYADLARISNTSTGTITTATSVRADLVNNGSGTVSTWYGVVVPPTNGTAATTEWPLYITNTNTSYFAGAIAVGNLSPSASAILELTSTTKGFLPPRMTTTQRDAISAPAEGLTVYNTTTDALNVYSGTAWGAVGAGASALSGLTDVTITSAADNDVLQYDSGTSKWVNVPASSAMTTTTMVANWPDAIRCIDATYNRILYLRTINATDYVYTMPWTTDYSVLFNKSTGAYSGQVNLAGVDCVINGWSITQLYAQGRAFNFIGTGAVTTFNVGTAAAPGLAVTSDTDSGLFQATANTLSLAAGGVEVLRGLNTASAVNYFTLTPSTGTSTVTLASAGTGATIPITIDAKGTSSIVLSDAVTASAGLSVTGTVTATTFSGSGASITSLPLTTGVTGTLPVANGGTGITSLGTGVATFLGTPSSTNLAAAVTGETGTGALVFDTAPTFTTSITAPLVIGGTATTADLILKTTSGVGAAGADMIFQVGNNGATEAMRILNSGNVGIGSNNPANKLDVSGNVAVSGTVTATTFSGSGASLTSLPAANLTGTLPAISGANLTNLDASDLASGTVPTARLGTGTANSTTYLRGDNTWATPAGGTTIPSGAVMAFDISSCPSGWTALAGAAGRVIVGVGSNGTNTYSLAGSGGADSLTLSTAQLPSHTHTVDPPSTATDSQGAHTHTISPAGTTVGTYGIHTNTYNGGNSTKATSSSGAHTHTVNIASFDTGATGSGSAVDNRQAYYALLYCRKD